jgi:tripartite-type tricarboxylate transporter receptor subunit TctC
MNLLRLVIALAFSLCCSAAELRAEEQFPARTVKIIVPSSAGGVTDVLGRMVGQAMAKAWNVPVVVDNRPGADGMIGMDLVAKSERDGYTLLVSSDASFTAGPHLHADHPYDTLKDFTPIAFLGQISPTFNVPASLPVKSIAEFIALAKSKPGVMNYASFGNGTYAHLSMEDFKKRAGINLVHLPYKGSSPALLALLRGDVSAMIVNISIVADQAKAGSVRMIAAAGAKRSKFLPDLPTVAESGVPGFATGAWWGLFGPAGLPPQVVTKIRHDVLAYLREPEAQKFFELNTMEPLEISPEDFTNLIRKDYNHWGALIKELDIKLD